MCNVSNFRHKSYIRSKKNRASRKLLALFKSLKKFIYLVLPPEEIAAAQIIRPNTILLMKSAKL